MNYKIKGFTLIEVLVSTTILSMILLVASVTFNYFSSRYESAALIYKQASEQTLNIIRLENTLESLLDYYVEENDKKQTLFFEGGLTKALFVSSEPISGSERTSLIRVSLQDNDVLYDEWNLITRNIYTRQDITQLQLNASDFSKVLFSDVEEFKIGYLSSKDRNHYYANTVETLGKRDAYHNLMDWRENLTASTQRVMPYFVKLEVVDAESRFELIVNTSAFNHNKYTFLQDE